MAVKFSAYYMRYFCIRIKKMNFSGWETFYTRISYAEKFDIRTTIFDRTRNVTPSVGKLCIQETGSDLQHNFVPTPLE